MYASPSGANSLPATPDSVSSGTNTSATMKVAYTTELRTSTEASSTTSVGGPRIAPRGSEPQPAKDVLGVDDGIVHHLAERDRQTAEHHDVEADAEVVEHQHGAEQRRRDRGGADERGARVEQKQEQHDHHQRRADQQVALHIAHRGLDEVGGTEQPRIERDLLLPASSGSSSFSARSRSRVTARVLAPSWPCTIRNTPGLPLIAAALMDGRRRLGHLGHIAQTQHLPRLLRQHNRAAGLRPSAAALRR